MKILLIEPNIILAKQYCASLKIAGHDVFWRQDAQTAIIAADEKSPDIVITELLLAGHSGIEFLYEFRSYGDWINVPVVILSSTSKENSGVNDKTLQDLGVVHYFYKPLITLTILNQAVNRILSTSKA